MNSLSIIERILDGKAESIRRLADESEGMTREW